MSARDALGREIAATAEVAQLSEAEQLDMLPSRFPADDRRSERVREAVRRDRAGRPPGARNIATRQALDFVRKVLGDPMIERARMAMHTPESLAIELGCTKLQAAMFIDSIRADLQRLFYAPLAPVDGAGNPVVPFFALQIGGQQGAPGAAAPPWIYQGGPVLDNEQNQQVSAAAEAVSHEPVSHEPPK